MNIKLLKRIRKTISYKIKGGAFPAVIIYYKRGKYIDRGYADIKCENPLDAILSEIDYKNIRFRYKCLGPEKLKSILNKRRSSNNARKSAYLNNVKLPW